MKRNPKRAVLFCLITAAVAFYFGYFQSHAATLPSPTPMHAQIFAVQDLGNHQAPQAFHVSAFPDVQATIPLKNCPVFAGQTDLEEMPVSVWPSATLAQRQGTMNCIRERDQAYADYVSKTFLGGGNIAKASVAWDFGDPKGQYNQVHGFNASHAYDVPGTYTVTLTLTNGLGQTAIARTTTTVLPDTRKQFYVDAKLGNDSNAGTTAATPWKTLSNLAKLPQGGRNIALRRGGAYFLQSGSQVKLGANDWVHAYGPFSDGYATLWNDQANGNLFSFDAQGYHMAVTGLKLDSSPTTLAGLGNVYGRNVLIRNNALGRINTFLIVNGLAYGQQTQGVLIQGNGNPPQNGVWKPDASSSYFAFISGKQVAVYGNWIKVKAPLGQPVMRTCGMKVQDVSFVNNHVFGDVANKHDPVSIRNGRNVYLSGNVIYSGDANLGSRCSPNSGPNEAVNNVVFENNTFEDATLHVEGGTLNVRATKNYFHANNPSISDLEAFQAITVEGGYADIPPTTGIVIDQNQALNEYDSGRFITFGTKDLHSVELTNNVFYAPLASNTWYHSITHQVKGWTLAQGKSVFTKVSGNKYYLKPSQPLKVTAFDDVAADLATWNQAVNGNDQVLDITQAVVPHPDAGVAK